HVIANKEIERHPGMKIQQVYRDETVIKVTWSRTCAASRHFPFKANFTLFRWLKLLCREKHIFCIIKNLNLVIKACDLSHAYAQPLGLYNNCRVWLPITPERAIGQSKAAIFPMRINTRNNAVIACITERFFLLRLHVRGCLYVVHAIFL